MLSPFEELGAGSGEGGTPLKSQIPRKLQYLGFAQCPQFPGYSRANARAKPGYFRATREESQILSRFARNVPRYFRASREIHLDILALRAALFVFAGNQHIALYFTSL